MPVLFKFPSSLSHYPTEHIMLSFGFINFLLTKGMSVLETDSRKNSFEAILYEVNKGLNRLFSINEFYSEFTVYFY